MQRVLAVLAVLALVTAVGAAGCAPRQVEVRTGPQPVTETTLRVTNNLTQAVNVYVVSGGSDIFLRQVPARGTEAMSVPGVAAGTTVTLKAVPVDGSRTYTRDNVALTTVYDWQVP